MTASPTATLRQRIGVLRERALRGPNRCGLRARARRRRRAVERRPIDSDLESVPQRRCDRGGPMERAGEELGGGRAAAAGVSLPARGARRSIVGRRRLSQLGQLLVLKQGGALASRRCAGGGEAGSFDLWECNECPPETSQEFFSSESPVVEWVWFDLWSGGDLVADGPDDNELWSSCRFSWVVARSRRPAGERRTRGTG